MGQESFRLVLESSDGRVGVRQQGPEHGIEVLVRIASPGLELRPAAARGRLDILEALVMNGYRLVAQDGWWVVCEKAVGEREIAMEEGSVLSLLKDLLAGP